MAQHDMNIANATFPAVRTDLNNALSAINSMQSGTSRPASAVAGTMWLDTTNATNPTIKFFDGTDDIQFATVNYSANTIDFLDSSLSTPITVTGSSSAGAEIRLPEDTDNGSNYVALKAPDTIASNLTLTLPATDGASGQALITNGSGVLSFASAGLAWQSVQTTGFTAVKGNAYPCNTTSSAFTVTLPSTPSAGDQVQLLDYAGTFDTNALTVNPNGGKIEGGTSNLQLKGDREGVTLVYIDSTQGWLASSGIQEGTDALEPIIYSVDFLVVAGGGGGGGGAGQYGGGGGAGGYRTSTQTVTQGTAITVTVGDGGAIHTSGSNSSISGTGLSTITSAGGGKGGSSISGTAGGSGGGAGGSGTGGSGNTPSTSPSQGNNGGNGSGGSDYAGGGGGGASAVGVNAGADTPGSAGGAGGAGTASSITGSSVTRAGGGGGQSYNGTVGAGGTGGGGAGGSNIPNLNAVAGGTNTGGGGGGGSTIGGIAGAGGKGVVILSMPDASYSGTTTGSPTVATGVSGKTVLTFNGTGSYTA